MRSGAAGDAAPHDVVGVPRLVPALRKRVASIAAGGSHTLALLDDGSVLAFGRGASGGPPADSHTPVELALPAGRRLTERDSLPGAFNSLGLPRKLMRTYSFRLVVNNMEERSWVPNFCCRPGQAAEATASRQAAQAVLRYARRVCWCCWPG